MDYVPDYYHPGSQLSAKIMNGGLVTDAFYTVIDAFTPFTMSQVLVVRANHESQSCVILKVYDPRFFSHRFRGRIQHPWSYDAEKEAARQRATLNEPFDFVFPLEIPEDDDKVGWEEWYYQQAEVFANREVTAYRHLTPLQDRVFPSASARGHLISQVVPSHLTCSFSNTSLTHKPSKESQPISSHNLSLTRSLSPRPGLALWESHIPTQTQATSSSLLDRMALYVVPLLLILGARICGSKSRMKTGHLS
jgi:hypothetical protein